MRNKGCGKIFLIDIKRAVWNPGFMIGGLGLSIILMRTVWEFREFPGTVPIMEICSLPMALSEFTIFSAAFPAWGYANQFYKEEKSKYIYFILSRMSWRKYLIMRIFSVSVSGFAIMAIPMGITFGFAYEMGSSEMGSLFSGMHVCDIIVKYGIPVVLCIKTCLGGLYGIFWALIGFGSSLLVKNKYVPYLIPFILNQFFWIVFSEHPKLNPVFLVRGEDLDCYSLSAFILLCYCLIAALVSAVIFRKRVIQ